MSTEQHRNDSKPRSPLVQAALRAAVAGAAPRVPQNAPSCPKVPRPPLNLQNEPTALTRPTANTEGEPARPRAGRSSQRNLENEPIKRPEMPHNARICPVNTLNMQNEPTDGLLTPRQLTAISALFAGHSFSETARYLRIDRKTLFRWRNSAPFIAEVRRRYAQQMSAPSSSSRAGLRG